MTNHTIGIICGCNLRAAQALKETLLKFAPNTVEILMTNEEISIDRTSEYASSDRKINLFNETEQLIASGADLIVVPDFTSSTYLDEVQREVEVPLLGILQVISQILENSSDTLGILLPMHEQKDNASSLKNNKKILVTTPTEQHTLNNLRWDIHVGFDDNALDTLIPICQRLQHDGARLIVPNCINLALMAPALNAHGIKTLSVIELFAKAILQTKIQKQPKSFKLGIIGGLGPAATVDLYDKIVKATPAKTDQEHFKVVIEQNPQIDDRTACLLNGGADPTLAMYNCAKRLQNDGCDYVIIPCNTAHAFLPRLLRHLKVPFIDMQKTMLEHIKEKFGKDARIGLLATSGTLKTGIYSKKARTMELQMFTPDTRHQERVMNAIYGPQGAKAGYTTGICYEDLYSAAEYLVKEHNCNVLILGCTELPLIFHEQDDFEVAGQKVAIVDPTATLARKCVEVAQKTILRRGKY